MYIYICKQKKKYMQWGCPPKKISSTQPPRKNMSSLCFWDRTGPPTNHSFRGPRDGKPRGLLNQFQHWDLKHERLAEGSERVEVGSSRGKMATTWRMDHPRYWGSSWGWNSPRFLTGQILLYKGVSKNRGGPPKWMVKIMENPIKMDDLGVPVFSETSI